ncbi:unnamed protein product [Protopolystoma xenopodis]|uniref:Uncharacterized protein n=1 Tax=Protopolystoma xenopodis TaxID=117903 RepID=A0A3S4ZV16_9PLAT|nr:unnamed protein product [Protopolystoma xenopodis]
MEAIPIRIADRPRQRIFVARSPSAGTTVTGRSRLSDGSESAPHGLKLLPIQGLSNLGIKQTMTFTSTSAAQANSASDHLKTGAMITPIRSPLSSTLESFRRLTSHGRCLRRNGAGESKWHLGLPRSHVTCSEASTTPSTTASSISGLYSEAPRRRPSRRIALSRAMNKSVCISSTAGSESRHPVAVSCYSPRN